jgi:outer membrane protein insertion porin family
VMLTPDRSGIEISITIEEGPRYRIRQLRVYERGEGGAEVEPINGRRHLRNLVRAQPGDYFNRAELLEDLQAIRTMYRDQASRTSRRARKPGWTRRARGGRGRPRRGADAGALRADRIPGQHEDARSCPARELEVEEGQPFHETNLEDSRKRITAFGYFERVDVSTEVGLRPDRPPRLHLGDRAAHRDVPGRRGVLEHRELHRDGARSSRPTSSGTASRTSRSRDRSAGSAAGQPPVHRALPAQFPLQPCPWICFDQLRIYTDFAQSSLGGALTFGYPSSSEAGRVANLPGTLRRGFRPRTRHLLRDLQRHQRLPTPAARQPLQRRLHSSVRPAITLDTRDNRLFPTAGSTSAARPSSRPRCSARRTEFLRHRGIARFYFPLPKKIVLKLTWRPATSPAPPPTVSPFSRASSSAAASTSAATASAPSGRAYP